MVWKVLNKGSAGSGTEFGANDLDKIGNLFSGVTDVDTVLINSPFGIRDNKFGLRNPANTFEYRWRTAAITANRDINMPLLTTSDTPVFNDFAATLANKILAGGRVSNYADIETTSTPSNPALNVLRLYRDPSTNILTVRKNDGSVVDLETSAALGAHKANHVSGGSDPFAKNDNLNAAARYLDDVADPSSDSQRLWIADGTADVKYWSDEGSPVKHVLERQANKGVVNGYAELDGSGVVPATRTAHKDSAVRVRYLQTFGHNHGKGDSGYGLMNGRIITVGTHATSALSTGVRSTWTTGATSGNQAGFRTDLKFLRREHAFRWRLRWHIDSGSLTSVSGFIGLVNDGAAFVNTSDPLNAKQGLGISWDTGLSANYRFARNDGSGATAFEDWLTPTALSTTTYDMEIWSDHPNTTIRIALTGQTDKTMTTNVPTNTEDMALQAVIETETTAARIFHIGWCEGETRTWGGGQTAP